MLHECPECGAEYTSRLAAEECGEFDRTEQQRQREYTRAHEAPKERP